MNSRGDFPTLSPTRADVFGQPLARIHWQVHEDDCRLFSQIAELALSQWAAGPLARLAVLKARDREAIKHDLVAGGGIYHPAGTTRMGARAADSVVDTQLRVHGLDGLWAVATSVFPTVGGTSPSLGLMQLALRAADDIVGSVAGNAQRDIAHRSEDAAQPRDPGRYRPRPPRPSPPRVASAPQSPRLGPAVVLPRGRAQAAFGTSPPPRNNAGRGGVVSVPATRGSAPAPLAGLWRSRTRTVPPRLRAP